jgi:hypothetical protein
MKASFGRTARLRTRFFRPGIGISDRPGADFMNQFRLESLPDKIFNSSIEINFRQF